MRKFSFCGIFATLFVTTTIILLASCSQDDDYYESDMYTLAEMGTRGGGGDDYNVDPPKNYFLLPGSKEHTVFIGNQLGIGLDVVFTVSWTDTIRVGDKIDVTSVTQNNHSQIECLDTNGQTIYINEYEYLGHNIPLLLLRSSGNLPRNYCYYLESGYIYYERAVWDSSYSVFLGRERDSVYVFSTDMDVSDFVVLKPVI